MHFFVTICSRIQCWWSLLVLVQNFEVDLEQVCGWWFLLVWSHDEVDRFWGERFVGGVEGGGRRGGEGGGRGGGEHWIAAKVFQLRRTNMKGLTWKRVGGSRPPSSRPGHSLTTTSTPTSQQVATPTPRSTSLLPPARTPRSRSTSPTPPPATTPGKVGRLQRQVARCLWKLNQLSLLLIIAIKYVLTISNISHLLHLDLLGLRREDKSLGVSTLQHPLTAHRRPLLRVGRQVGVRGVRVCLEIYDKI